MFYHNKVIFCILFYIYRYGSLKPPRLTQRGEALGWHMFQKLHFGNVKHIKEAVSLVWGKLAAISVKKSWTQAKELLRAALHKHLPSVKRSLNSQTSQESKEGELTGEFLAVCPHPAAVGATINHFSSTPRASTRVSPLVLSPSIFSLHADSSWCRR